MVISIKNYQGNGNQRTISEAQEELIKNLKSLIDIQEKSIQFYASLCNEFVKELNEWRTKAGQQPLRIEDLNGCEKGIDMAMIYKL